MEGVISHKTHTLKSKAETGSMSAQWHMTLWPAIERAMHCLAALAMHCGGQSARQRRAVAHSRPRAQAQADRPMRFKSTFKGNEGLKGL